MGENPLVGIAMIFVLGVGAQWVAWRVRLPAILLLLLAGMAVGPGSAWLVQKGVLHAQLLDPEKLLGSLLLPVVSLSVGVILFEGGLTLAAGQVAGVGHVVGKLVTIGAALMWMCGALGAHFILGFNAPLAILTGAILMVTGPTVIGPLLRHVRPVGQVGPVLRWEGIVIDPIGALLAVLVFQAASGGTAAMPAVVIKGMLMTLAVGVGVGFAGAVMLVVMLRRYWVPDYLQSAVTLMMVATAFTASNAVQHEAGLFACTVMGIVLANQQFVSIHPIQEFKENLTILLISSLFIVLGARLKVEQIEQLQWAHIWFVLGLVVIARPLAILASTLGPGLSWKEKVFMAWMAPRGVVAASVASVFAIELRDAGVKGAEGLVPAVFAVIVGTVTIYGLTAAMIARRLGLARPEALGFLIVGANPVARAVGKALQEEGYDLLLVDTSMDNVRQARLDGLPVFLGSVNSQQVMERIQLSGIGRLLALTPSQTVNALAVSRFVRLFGRAEVYQLGGAGKGVKAKAIAEQCGRELFHGEMGYGETERLIEKAGGKVKRTKLTEQFGMGDFEAANPKAVVLFVIESTGGVRVMTAENKAVGKAGEVVVSLAGEELADEKVPPRA